MAVAEVLNSSAGMVTFTARAGGCEQARVRDGLRSLLVCTNTARTCMPACARERQHATAEAARTGQGGQEGFGLLGEHAALCEPHAHASHCSDGRDRSERHEEQRARQVRPALRRAAAGRVRYTQRVQRLARHHAAGRQGGGGSDALRKAARVRA
jgi:hypothetical protein